MVVASPSLSVANLDAVNCSCARCAEKESCTVSSGCALSESNSPPSFSCRAPEESTSEAAVRAAFGAPSSASSSRDVARAAARGAVAAGWRGSPIATRSPGFPLECNSRTAFGVPSSSASSSRDVAGAAEGGPGRGDATRRPASAPSAGDVCRSGDGGAARAAAAAPPPSQAAAAAASASSFSCATALSAARLARATFVSTSSAVSVARRVTPSLPRTTRFANFACERVNPHRHSLRPW